jgi:hypothetical protein
MVTASVVGPPSVAEKTPLEEVEERSTVRPPAPADIGDPVETDWRPRVIGPSVAEAGEEVSPERGPVVKTSCSVGAAETATLIMGVMAAGLTPLVAVMVKL